MGQLNSIPTSHTKESYDIIDESGEVSGTDSAEYDDIISAIIREEFC